MNGYQAFWYWFRDKVAGPVALERDDWRTKFDAERAFSARIEKVNRDLYTEKMNRDGIEDTQKRELGLAVAELAVYRRAAQSDDGFLKAVSDARSALSREAEDRYAEARRVAQARDDAGALGKL